MSAYFLPKNKVIKEEVTNYLLKEGIGFDVGTHGMIGVSNRNMLKMKREYQELFKFKDEFNIVHSRFFISGTDEVNVQYAINTDRLYEDMVKRGMFNGSVDSTQLDIEDYIEFLDVASYDLYVISVEETLEEGYTVIGLDYHVFDTKDEYEEACRKFKECEEADIKEADSKEGGDCFEYDDEEENEDDNIHDDEE